MVIIVTKVLTWIFSPHFWWSFYYHSWEAFERNQWAIIIIILRTENSHRIIWLADWILESANQVIQMRWSGLWPEGISQRRFFSGFAYRAEFLHKHQALLRHLSLLWSNLKQLWMLLHDVHQHVVDVAPQVKVHILLVLQGLPHLESFPQWKMFPLTIRQKENKEIILATIEKIHR